MRASASLPMYPQPGAKPAWMRVWSHVGARLRERGVPAPRQLSWPSDLHRVWTAPDLFLSQTCALPYIQSFHRHASVLGAFDFGLPGCPPGTYCSWIITRQGESRAPGELLRAGRVAINGFDSQSGYGSLSCLGPLPERPLVTGSHAMSLRAVKTGQADLAAIDAVSWRFLSRLPGATFGLRVHGQTPPTPGTPLITGRRHMADPMRAALADAFATAPLAPMRWLGLRGFVPRGDADYLNS